MKFGIDAEIFTNPRVSRELAVVPKPLSSICATQQDHISLPFPMPALATEVCMEGKDALLGRHSKAKAATALLCFLFLQEWHALLPQPGPEGLLLNGTHARNVFLIEVTKCGHYWDY